MERKPINRFGIKLKRMNMTKPFYASCLLALSLLIPLFVKAEPTALQYQQIINDNIAENEPGYR